MTQRLKTKHKTKTKTEKLKERKYLLTKDDQNFSEEKILLPNKLDHETDGLTKERLDFGHVLLQASNASSLPGNGAKILMDKFLASLARLVQKHFPGNGAKNLIGFNSTASAQISCTKDKCTAGSIS